jgi:hypothetical protein
MGNSAFFYYLLDEYKRKGIKASSDLFDKINAFIESEEGQETLIKFNKLGLWKYVDSPEGKPREKTENPFNKFL